MEKNKRKKVTIVAVILIAITFIFVFNKNIFVNFRRLGEQIGNSTITDQDQTMYIFTVRYMYERDDKPGEISYPFENDYETQADLSLTKVVKGTYASKTQLFDFDVNLVDGLPEAGTYQIEYYNADGTKADGAINENPTTITSGTSIKIKLKHGEKIVIKELPSSATYTITENQLGTYTAEYVANGNETMAPTTATGSAGLGANFTAIGKLSDNGIEDGYLSDEEIVYTNTKELTVPTGVMMSVLPFACGIALIAGFVVVTSRKRQED